MKFPLPAALLGALLLCPALLPAAEPPSGIGGFSLGGMITDYPELEFSPHLREVVIDNWHGFSQGTISYGTCANPGQIIKMRMTYQDSSKEFYDLLLSKFKERYGKPGEWKGDAFGILYMWQWRFVDKDNRRVNLILQHNLQSDANEVGNVVKLSLPELEEEERLCFIRFCEEQTSAEEKEKIKQRMKPDWGFMIPR